MLFQALKPSSTVMVTLGAGMILHDSYGTLNEVLWNPGMAVAGDLRLQLNCLFYRRGDRKPPAPPTPRLN